MTAGAKSLNSFFESFVIIGLARRHSVQFGTLGLSRVLTVQSSVQKVIHAVFLYRSKDSTDNEVVQSGG
jgi:hypothetical protein